MHGAVDHRRNVLQERAAKRDIQNLHPAADREDRQLGVHRGLDERYLVFVPSRL
jgi:hypothetical protein